MEEFQVVQLSDSNFRDLVPLYEKSFNKVISEHELKRKFDTSSICGFKNVGFIAYDKDSIAAAFYGAFPCFAEKKGGEAILVVQSGDTMVDPKYRRKKLFPLLAEKTFEWCEQNGVQAVFGFPNQLSFPSFVKKLKWKHIHNIKAYHVRVRSLPFIKVQRILSLKEDFFLRYQMKYLKKRSVKPKAFKSFISNENNYVVKRDANFIDYKNYTEKYFLSIEGVQVWLKPSKMFLYVGDIEFCSEQKILSVINQLKKHAFWLGIPHVRIQISANSDFVNFAEKYLSKFDNEYPVGIRAFNGFQEIEKFSFTLADNDTF